MKNLVIGTAIGYDTDDLKNFVLSFRACNSHDDVIIFLDQESLYKSKEFLQIFNIQTQLFDSLKYIQAISSTVLAFNMRFIRSYELLYNTDEYKHILISDVRDVVFQSNPFENLPDEFLYLFSDDNYLSIENNIYNNDWVLMNYPEFYNRLKSLPIICCGTIMGSKNQIMNCLRCMHEELMKLSNKNIPNMMLVDQAVLIFIAHMYPDHVLPRTIKINGDLVGTIGINCTTEFVLNRPRDLVRFDMGKVYINDLCPAIIHQYDRSPFLANFYNSFYSINKIIN